MNFETRTCCDDISISECLWWSLERAKDRSMYYSIPNSISAMSKPYPALSQRGEELLVEQLTQWSLANGLIMYPPNFQSYQANVAPVTLYPTPFPRDQFDKSISISKQYNSLYSNIIIEKNWLLSIIKNLSKFDSDFTGKLYESYLNSIEIGIVQPVSLGLFRSDYMLDLDTNLIKQVEFNTVSVSFGGLSSKISELHKFLNDIGMYNNEDDKRVKYYKDEELAISKSSQELAKGLYEGVSYYNKTHDAKDTVVLFVVQPNERNAFDQRAIEYNLLSQYGVRSKRIELPEVLKKVSIKGDDRRLYIDEDGDDEVSVVYYRSAYGPQEFVEFPEAWECRTQLETSLAIKCPSLLVQLSGAKKVQQLLTNDEVFNKFTTRKDNNESLKSTFVKIYPLDNSEEGKLGKQLAFEKSENFVLKPQREGGGNNIYKNDIPKFLKELNEEEWQGYILMELINPPIFKDSVIFRNGELIKEGIISELGIFSCLLFNESTGDVIVNECCDHLLRSKTSGSNEGGVAAGFGCVDSLYLY